MLSLKKRFLGVNNAFEGTLFINETVVANMTLSDYVAQLVPQFDKVQIDATVAQYNNIGLVTIADQAAAVLGECKLYHYERRLAPQQHDSHFHLSNLRRPEKVQRAFLQGKACH